MKIRTPGTGIRSQKGGEWRRRVVVYGVWRVGGGTRMMNQGWKSFANDGLKGLIRIE
jgi:hypothetical protein